MDPSHDQPEQKGSAYAFNMTLAAVAGQVGCLTLVIVLAALFGGIWLDSHFSSKPIFTVVLMVASIPVTLVAMFWVVGTATARMQQANKQPRTPGQEEAGSGKDT
jgi:ABC-type transport system involved in cytochrome c biogenesis permease subunit